MNTKQKAIYSGTASVIGALLLIIPAIASVHDHGSGNTNEFGWFPAIILTAYSANIGIWAFWCGRYVGQPKQ
jgi:hypothetical protein